MNLWESPSLTNGIEQRSLILKSGSAAQAIHFFMAKYLDIAIIGSGNVAWHLSQALENAGHHLCEIFSRKPRHAEALVRTLYNAEAKDSLDFSESPATIFIIAVSDDAIGQVAGDLILPSSNSIVVHTSGSVSMDVLDYTTNNHGVFYPLQSFTKSRKPNFKEVPILIEASNKETKSILLNLAKTISEKVSYLNEDQRKALHVSAVFASNFTNHLLFIAKKLAKNNKIDFHLLESLIIETINKSLEIGPEKAQTGPAARGDLQVLDNHLDFLKEDEALQEIYKVLTQHILDQRYYEQ